MDQLIQRILQLSSEFAEQPERYEFEEIEQYMKERNELFLQFRREFAQQAQEPTTTQRALVKQVLELDAVCIARMRQVHERLGEEVDKFQAGKKSREAYDTPYSYGQDSHFFDSKR